MAYIRFHEKGTHIIMRNREKNAKMKWVKQQLSALRGEIV